MNNHMIAALEQMKTAMTPGQAETVNHAIRRIEEDGATIKAQWAVIAALAVGLVTIIAMAAL